jgi:hypothetical protein
LEVLEALPGLRCQTSNHTAYQTVFKTILELWKFEVQQAISGTVHSMLLIFLCVQITVALMKCGNINPTSNNKRCAEEGDYKTIPTRQVWQSHYPAGANAN